MYYGEDAVDIYSVLAEDCFTRGRLCTPRRIAGLTIKHVLSEDFF